MLEMMFCLPAFFCFSWQLSLVNSNMPARFMQSKKFIEIEVVWGTDLPVLGLSGVFFCSSSCHENFLGKALPESK